MRVGTGALAWISALVALLAVAPATAPAAADVVPVDVRCDVPPARGIAYGAVPETLLVEDRPFEVHGPQSAVQGSTVRYSIRLLAPDLRAGLGIPDFVEDRGIVRVHRLEVRLPIPAGLTTSTERVSVTPSVPWLRVSRSGDQLVFVVQSSVTAGGEGRVPMRIDLDAPTPQLEVPMPDGSWEPVDPIPLITITGTAAGAPGTAIELAAPSSTMHLDHQVSFPADGPLAGQVLSLDWSDQAVPCVPEPFGQTVARTLVVPASCLPPEFPDVAETSPFFAEVCWMVADGITDGFDDGTYRPGAPVTRQATAALLHRFAGDETPSDCEADLRDVDADDPFFEDVCWMVDAEVATGYLDGTFRPAGTVSRGAMATYLHRLAGEPAPEASDASGFSDVPPGHPQAEAIEWLVGAGIAGGFDDGTFRPSAPVTRQSMAAFLQRMATA